MLTCYQKFIIRHILYYKGCYTSAHVLVNLSNKMRRDKMLALPSISSLFCKEFNKFNNTGAKMIDLSYDIKITLKLHFWLEKIMILPLCIDGWLRMGLLPPP